MLREQTLFGLHDKTAIAIERLRTFEPPEGYHLAFSGGKDSQTIYELSVMAGVRFDAHMSLTTVDPPELIAFVKTSYPTVELHRPQESMWRLIRRKGTFPTRIMRFCCESLKESLGDGRTVVTGVRAAESARRSHRSMIEVDRRPRRNRRFLHPIIDWTEADVWQFHAERGLPHVCLYDEGWTRVGCIGCPMAGHANRVRDFARWPGYRLAYLNSIRRAMEARPDKIFKQANDAEGMMAWWLEESPKQERNECYLLDLWA